MKRTYVFKLNPTFKQKNILENTFGAVRFIYNWGLSRKIENWNKDKKYLSYFDLAKELTILKKNKEYIWLKEINNESLQQSLRNLENAYTKFFKAKSKFPKFKSKKYSKNSIKYLQGIKIDFINYKIWIPKCGWIKLYKNKVFDINKNKVGTVTIIKDNLNIYWCNILVDDNKNLKSKAKILNETSVGIDLGISNYITLSNGDKIDNPKFLEFRIQKLKQLQKKLARAKKDSNNYNMIKNKIAKKHKKILNKRNDFLHKLSKTLLDNYDTICLENLNVKGLLKNKKLSQTIQSAAWHKFVGQLLYKADWNGKNIIFIGRFEPSSKLCNNCGYINRNLQLSDRKWICPKCGAIHDRDINAAMNIKDMALNPQAIIAIKEKAENIVNI